MGHMMAPPKCFCPMYPNALEEEAEAWGLLILIYAASKNYFWVPRLSGVTMATSLSGSTRKFLKLSFLMFPYNEILKVFKSKI